ncbi:MAG: pyruvate carboxylase subunit B [Candidatus Thermoplasmatota archaeon]|nr:pyruvate carboxylase subunit B [Candidatus Thermoplasmatota archaeon]
MVQLHDQTLRDAHQSVLATRLRTEDMLPICDKMDQVGFDSMEIWGGATFDACIRYLDEDPWERLNKLSDALPNTRVQMLERAMNIVAYKNYPDDVVKKFVHYAYKNGCESFRIFDALNDLRNMKVPIEKAKEEGAHVQGSLCYTISPIHTVEKYVEKFKKLEKMGCDSLCVKDMAGMISPSRAYDIIKGCKDAGIKIPIDLHSHKTSGMTGMAYMKACEAGVDVLDTSFSSLTGATGQPETEGVTAALKDTEYDTGYDMDLLMDIKEYFDEIWEKYRHLHRDQALKVDPSVTVHQIPGGMLSNLVNQLEKQGAADKYNEVLEEVPRVREDFGYPPLVTPSSQIVGVQAVMNVKFGRYEKITNDTKEYFRGMYGRPPGEISNEMYEKILGPDWEEEVIDERPASLLEPQFKKNKDLLEDKGLLNKPEDVLTYTIYPDIGLKFLKGEVEAEFYSEDLPLEKPGEEKEEQKTARQISYPWKGKVRIDGKDYEVVMKSEDKVRVNGKDYNVSVLFPEGEQPAPSQAKSKAQDRGEKRSGEELEINSPMLGTILELKVSPGDDVKAGQPVAILEAMKMENDVTAPRDGKIKDIHVKKGQDVEEDDLIATMVG